MPDYQDSPPWQIKRVKFYEVAANHHNIELIGSLIDEDVLFEMSGQITLKGKEQILALHEYDAALDTRIKLYDYSVEQYAVSCRIMETNTWLSKSGVAQIEYSRAEILFSKDGLIKGFFGSLETKSAEAMGQVLASFSTWAAKHRPRDYSRLLDGDGSFVYNRESGERVLILLDEWIADRGG